MSIREPVTDFNSRQPRVDNDGKAISAVIWCGDWPTGSRHPRREGGWCEPQGLVLGAQVMVTGLVATTWQVGDRNGMSFRAEQVEVLSGPTTKAPVTPPLSKRTSNEPSH